MTELKYIAGFLGGKATVKYKISSRFDLIKLSKRGIPKKSLVHFATKVAGYSFKEFINFLPVSLRTLQRYKPQQNLDKVTSQYILEITALYARGIKVFGSLEKFRFWMNNPVHALGNRNPASLLDTFLGINELKDELGKIEHGIY